MVGAGDTRQSQCAMPIATAYGVGAGAGETFVVDVDGERLDRFLSRRCLDLSRSRAQALIGEGRVVVDGKVVKASARVRVGQAVEVRMPEPAQSGLAAQDIPLEVVYEDGDLLVVNKRAGMATHPAPGHPDGTLVNAVLARCPDLRGIGGTVRPGIVHRLDKDTSGLMVVAKNDMAHRGLSERLERREFTKQYIALACGRVSPGEAVIDAPIGRDRGNRKRMAIAQDGREAVTRYRVARWYAAHTLVDVMPTTGRTHQIRVHFAALGHPLVGDATYGRAYAGLERHFLHASRLGFRHPRDGGYREFDAPLPGELEGVLREVE